MLSTAIRTAYLQLHISVFLWGFTAILGDLISISALPLVWWRTLITCVTMLVIFKVIPYVRAMPRGILLQYMGIGILIAIHWVCFYGAIKLANASVTLICLSATSLFTAFIEPFFAKKPIRWREVGLGALIIPGMVLVVGAVPPTMYVGIFVGIMAALAAAAFSSWNKTIVEAAHVKGIMLVELASGFFFVSLMLGILYGVGYQIPFLPTRADVIYLAILSWACTLLPFLLSLKAVRHLSAFAANLTINLEPVYGVILAWLILHEHKQLTPQFYWGGSIVVLAVIAYPLLQGRKA